MRYASAKLRHRRGDAAQGLQDRFPHPNQWEEVDHEFEDSVAGSLLSPTTGNESEGDPLGLGNEVRSRDLDMDTSTIRVCFRSLCGLRSPRRGGRSHNLQVLRPQDLSLRSTSQRHVPGSRQGNRPSPELHRSTFRGPSSSGGRQL
ncbi:hypothetical protein FA13DRAFT_1321951 [Coprinellus micaceus]|uniref:Uncharacterized protein n=1 Tax=Coprinellus micaceus TaxID=71717 RepID=A0A4Y7R5H2_COPMI|nr:hypothetical protein FA13DRAFT_1321951 [Coprinellus micaceus]